MALFSQYPHEGGAALRWCDTRSSGDCSVQRSFCRPASNFEESKVGSNSQFSLALLEAYSRALLTHVQPAIRMCASRPTLKSAHECTLLL